MTTTSDGRPPGDSSTKGGSAAAKGETPPAKPETAPTRPVATRQGPAPPPQLERAPTRPVASSPPGAVITPAPSAGATLPRQRRVHLTVNRIDPWTVLRLSFLLSVASAIITVVALMLLWVMLSAGGVFTSVDDSLESVLGDGALDPHAVLQLRQGAVGRAAHRCDRRGPDHRARHHRGLPVQPRREHGGRPGDLGDGGSLTPAAPVRAGLGAPLASGSLLVRHGPIAQLG